MQHKIRTPRRRAEVVAAAFFMLMLLLRAQWIATTPCPLSYRVKDRPRMLTTPTTTTMATVRTVINCYRAPFPR
uniref:Putative secreted protein n=1 Tax=Anopheles darlingi TaxID=43151 RepID=A0A2M4D7Z7_ANODA